MDKNGGASNEQYGDDDEVFDYDDLINDFTKDDYDGPPAKDLGSVDVSQLIDKNEAAEKSEPEKTDEETIADIFDELDDLARTSIYEDAGEDGESEDAPRDVDGGQDETEAGDEEDEAPFELEKDIDENDSDYASLLSQLEGGAQEEPPDADADMTADDDMAVAGMARADEDVKDASPEVAGDADDDFSFDGLFGGDEAEEETGEAELPVDEAGPSTDESSVEEILSVSDTADIDPPQMGEDAGGEDGDELSFEDILGVEEETSDAEEEREIPVADYPEDMISPDAELPDEEQASDDAGDAEEEGGGSYADVLGGLGGGNEDDAQAGQAVESLEEGEEVDEESYAGALSGFGGGDDSATAEVPVLEFGDDDMSDDTDETAASYEDALGGIGGEDVEITGEIELSLDASADETSDETVEEPSFESSFEEDDSLFESDEEEVPAAAEGSTEADEEDDFLGLGGMKTGGSGGSAGVEVLFEGVEMDYDEQVGCVTLAEVLIAQGREEEAADLLKSVRDKKGVTSWVAKRMNLDVPAPPAGDAEETPVEDSPSEA